MIKFYHSSFFTNLPDYMWQTSDETPDDLIGQNGLVSAFK